MRTADRITIGWIDPGLVDGNFATSLVGLFQHRPSRLDGIIRVEGGLLSRQRNEVVHLFLEHTDSEWLLMLDSDERIDVEAFDKLVAAVHDRDRPIVAGLYFGTWPGGLIPKPVPHIYRRSGDGVSVIPMLDYPVDSIIEIDGAGTGCLLVHRSVFERVRETSDDHEAGKWCWFRDLPINGQWLGEDLYFCRRVQDLGIPLHAHTGAVLGHRRRYWLDDAQFEAVRALEAYEAAQAATEGDDHD